MQCRKDPSFCLQKRVSCCCIWIKMYNFQLLQYHVCLGASILLTVMIMD
ncbi:rCG59615 [Rattus norvegicus]|uniref:RCG59615 n=1 Tax=Rattus norvegicus TaxID=10116 RepID=A6HR92_RAT|nr:rCG59615 [Rattus norvegicus]